MSYKFVNNNGKIIPAGGYVLEAGNRAYLYGDGVFETIRVFNGQVINLSNHIARLVEGASRLKMRIPAFYTVEFFQRQIEELVQKCEITKGARVRLSVDRMSGGTYIPDQNEPTFFIEVYPINESDFELNSKGLEVDVFMDMKKPKGKLANYKTKNGLLYVMAGISAREKGIDEYLIMNESNGIIESSNSNLFVVSNGVLYTPGLDEGCLAGTMRMQIINLALQNGFKVYECTILPQNLLSADEVFLTNAIRGVVWVVGYRTKRFFNNTSRKFVALLNDYWEKELSGETDSSLLDDE
ncbi:MAG: aminotransferase class IV [Crocinitomicaceae bacterium]|jgi:branched-chain amino acid aminotransferase|nr:aminotransferase class IV [Crocinitomicaceae bacterium]